MNIGIYGCGVWAKRISDYVSDKEVRIQYYVETIVYQDIYNGCKVVNVEDIDFSLIDYLVISSSRYRDEMIKALQGDVQKYKQNALKIIDRVDFIDLIYKDTSDFRLAKVEGGLNFIYTKEDLFVGPYMRMTGNAHASENIEYFFSLARKYAGYDGKGYFFDIGANIGTTSIYAKRCQPELKIIGFEPSKENYDLYRVNCLLNGMEEIYTINCALGRTDGNVNIIYNVSNPGGTYIKDVSDGASDSIGYVSMTSLDIFVEREGIKADDIALIWMDAEGFEDEIIIGGEKTLKKKSIPIVHEFNPKHYLKKGNVDEYCTIMKACYSAFIDINNIYSKREDVIPIEKLRDWVLFGNRQTDLFFFK